MTGKEAFFTLTIFFTCFHIVFAEPVTYTFQGKITAQNETYGLPPDQATYNMIGKEFSVTLKFDPQVNPSTEHSPDNSTTRGLDWSIELGDFTTNFGRATDESFGQPFAIIVNNSDRNQYGVRFDELGVFDYFRITGGGNNSVLLDNGDSWARLIFSVNMLDISPAGDPDALSNLEIPSATPNLRDFPLDRVIAPDTSIGFYASWSIRLPLSEEPGAPLGYAYENYYVHGKLLPSATPSVTIPLLSPTSLLSFFVLVALIVCVFGLIYLPCTSREI